MAFQIKNFVSIAAGMLNRFRGSQSMVTDFNVGAVGRTMFEAVCVEIDEGYQQMFNGLKEAVAVAVFNSFSFSLLPAVPASGLVRVSIAPNAAAILISTGTVFSNPAISYVYVTQADAVIPAGQTYVDVLAVASVAGSASNLNANTSFAAAPSPTGFASAVSLGAFLNGRDLETDVQRKTRFQAFISNISRGTPSAIEYGATTTALINAAGVQIERVALAKVIEPYVSDPTQPIALVNLFIHNGVGNTSSDLVTLCTEIVAGYVDPTGKKVPGYKAAGIPCPVTVATEVDLNVVAYLQPADGYDGPTLAAAAQGAIATYMLGLGIGETYVAGDAEAVVKAIPGVQDFIITQPVSNLPVTAPSQKFMPGAFTITPVAVEMALPTPVATVQITGAAQQGATLTAVSKWAGSPVPVITWQWFRDGAAIASATGETYLQTSADVGHRITVEDTATNILGSESTTSAPTAAVTAP